MEISETLQRLPNQRSNDTFLEPAMFLQTSPHASTRNIFQEYTQRFIRPLISKILYDMRMVQILQCFDLRIQGIQFTLTLIIIPITKRPRDFNLFYRQHFPRRCVQTQINGTISALSDKFTLDPFERS